MDNLFALLFLVAFIATIVLMIKPSLTARSGKAPLSRGKIFLYGLAVSLFSVAMVGVFAPKVDTNQLDVEQLSDDKTKVSLQDDVIVVSPVKQAAEKVEANLGMTPEEFRKSFNKKLKELEVDTIRPVAEFDIKKGEVRDSFQVAFSDATNLTGLVNKDGKLHELTFIVGGTQEYEKAMMDILILSGITAQVISPNSDGQSGKVVIDLINMALKGIQKENNTHSKVLGDVKYYALASEHVGLWIGVSPASDE